MKTWIRRMAAAGLLALAWTAAAGPAAGQSGAVRPGAPGQPSRPAGPVAAEAAARPRHTEADVRFVQGMIPHHAQALEMTALVPARSTSRALHLIAQRIEVSQHDEIAWMKKWLRDRGEEAPALDAHGAHGGHGAHAAMMPGMLTPEQLAQLAQATGADFDRLFLRFMIQHHEGALTMVTGLLATPGAAQETEIFRFASDVEADQRAEIRRMRTLLDEPPPPPAAHDHH